MDARADFEVAQRVCDDVVLAAGSFKPNAPGRWELSSLTAVAERQLLKSKGAYFAERMIIAVTPIEVVAIAVDAASLLRSRRLVWKRSELSAQLVPSRIEEHRSSGPALHLSNAGFSPRIEVVPVSDNDAGWSVIDSIWGGSARGYDRV